MSKYMLFSYDNYYPSGGTNDLDGCFDTKEELLDEISNVLIKNRDNIDIFSIHLRKTIEIRNYMEKHTVEDIERKIEELFN